MDSLAYHFHPELHIPIQTRKEDDNCQFLLACSFRCVVHRILSSPCTECIGLIPRYTYNRIIVVSRMGEISASKWLIV